MRLFRSAFPLVFLLSCAWPAMADTTQAERPKIGLALSGGGARGGAHIGVLKALEELNVPVDYIAGTSMGAIIGAFYASGYSPDQIETIISETNWVDAFSDQSDRRGMTMRKKELDADFLIPHRVGFNKGVIQLPLGVLEGQKLDQIFQKAFLPVKDVRNFDELPIPFHAVATNLVTGSEVVIVEGSLADAVRASMSIPGFFAPVVIDDLMLVDGGMANNLPVSVVREMGADIVIAVDLNHEIVSGKNMKPLLSAAKPEEINSNEEPGLFSRWVGDYRLSMKDIKQKLLAMDTPAAAQFRKWASAEPLPSIFEVLLASINIIETRLTQTRLSLDRPDVLIQPPLGHIRFLEFGRAEEIIAIGYEHAQRQLGGWGIELV